MTVVFGGDGTELLEADPPPACVVKSTGIHPSVPLLRAAASANVEIIDEAELGWRLDSRPLVAVTGTNGKSTVAQLACSVLGAAGVSTCVAGNTYFGPPLSAVPEEHDAVVGELSSAHLEACPALLPEAAVFTNLTPHHLNRHGSLERYAECKRRLFLRDGAATELAILNIDDGFGQRLAGEAEGSGGRVVGYGRGEAADYRIQAVDWDLTGSRVRVGTPAGEMELVTSLAGPYNAHHAVAALALAGSLDIDLERAAASIAETPPVPGRLEVIREAPPFDVIVDYAHDPAGTAAVLGIARELLRRRGRGRLVGILSAVKVLSDPGEQREIGAVAGSLCDRVVLTSSRWDMTEPPAPPSPLVEGAQAANSAEVEIDDDRGAAIRGAIAEAGEGDCLLVLGRGAFGGRLFDSTGTPRPFDDRKIAREVLEERG
jgi:UDP-N-acetylmuramoyl-L-alanyl-D-glutamate--2,6-diaminopimelate ligase